jgi:cell division protein ZapB
MVAAMSSAEQLETELRLLERKLEQLLSANERLSDENRGLRLAHEQWANERAHLLSKNEQARSRVEAMISRLKALEQQG